MVEERMKKPKRLPCVQKKQCKDNCCRLSAPCDEYKTWLKEYRKYYYGK